jgi:hypothetical protein
MEIEMSNKKSKASAKPSLLGDKMSKAEERFYADLYDEIDPAGSIQALFARNAVCAAFTIEKFNEVTTGLAANLASSKSDAKLQLECQHLDTLHRLGEGRMRSFKALIRDVEKRRANDAGPATVPEDKLAEPTKAKAKAPVTADETVPVVADSPDAVSLTDDEADAVPTASDEEIGVGDSEPVVDADQDGHGTEAASAEDADEYVASIAEEGEVVEQAESLIHNESETESQE